MTAKHPILWLLLSTAAVAGCSHSGRSIYDQADQTPLAKGYQSEDVSVIDSSSAGTSLSRRDAHAVKKEKPETAPKELPRRDLPSWVNHPPTEPGYVYFVGEVLDSNDKEDALERAWYSGLIRFGLVEFSELTRISSRSSETLHSTEYRRDAVSELQLVNWRGLGEAKDKGSPFVFQDPKTNFYTVYRLLKWSMADVKAAHAQMKRDIAVASAAVEPVKYDLPPSPEVKQKEEDAAVDSVMQIRRLNKKIVERNRDLAKVLNEAKCGVTTSDISKILGEPDRNDTCLYYWGTYAVFACGGGTIDHITADLGKGHRHVLCGH